MNEPVRSDAGEAVDGAGNGEDLFTFLHGMVRGDQGAAAFGRLDDQHRPRKTGNQPIALRKVVLEWRHARRELRYEAASLREGLNKGAMFGRIVDVEPIAENSDGVAANLDRCLVRYAINPTSQPTNDDVAGPDEPDRE